MKTLHLTSYRYRGDLDDEDLQKLTKKYMEIGDAPGVTAHYERLDGRGGYVIIDTGDDPAGAYETILRYAPWIEFETVPVVSIEEAFPVIQRVYG